jgi:hypothetical protein
LIEGREQARLLGERVAMQPMPEFPKKKKFGWDWILWWRIDPGELDSQVEQYDTLSLWRAARKLSLLLLLLSACLTIALVQFQVTDNSAYWDAGTFVLLGALVYFGHRWAMIGAMILWTIEKVLTIGQGFEGPHRVNPVMQIIWWAIFMHAFYLAFRVEQEKRRRQRGKTAEGAEVT